MTSRLMVLTLCLLSFNFIQAQDLDTVTIFGRVVDQNGAVIPGAEIKTNTRTVTTDDRGRYRLIQLGPPILASRCFRTLDPPDAQRSVGP